MKPIPLKTSLLSFDLILEKAKINEGLTIADFGCGNSLFFLYALLTLVGSNGRIYGIDVLPEIIDSIKREIAHHDLGGITALQGNLDKAVGVPLSDDSLDRAFLINTLHQSTDTVSMFLEAKRLLRSDGYLIVVDWDNASSPLGPHQSRRLSSETAIESALHAGFKHNSSFSAGAYHYGLIFSK